MSEAHDRAMKVHRLFCERTECPHVEQIEAEFRGMGNSVWARAFDAVRLLLVGIHTKVTKRRDERAWERFDDEA